MTGAAEVMARSVGTRRRRQRLQVPPWVVSALLLPLGILGWHLVAANDLVPAILLPSPQAVWEAFPEVVGARGFSRHVQRTVAEIALGFLLGASTGFALGLILGASARLRRAYLPFLSALQAVPKVILAPLIIAWFGFGISGKIVQASIACFYAVFITTLSGLELADDESIQLMRSLRASPRQILWKVRVPYALPAIFGGLQIGATTAIIGGVVSEFVAADAGLGFLMLRYRSSFQTPSLWVLIFIFLLFGVTSYTALVLTERRVVFWRRAEKIRPEVEQP